MQYIAFDCHKRYTYAMVENAAGEVISEVRIDHNRGSIQHFLEFREKGNAVAVETVGNWYWIVDEIEAAGMVPLLVNARKAKLMMSSVNKTDRLDCHGLNRLQRTGTLPTVWIPTAEIRDLRDLPRTRMVLSRERTRLKNRIHAEFAKYGMRFEEVTDAFSKKGREQMQNKLLLLPNHTRFSVERLLEQLDLVAKQIASFEQRMRDTFSKNHELELLMTLPGVGLILASVILSEVGDIRRFPTAAQYASYAGTTPRVNASGDKIRYGRTRPDVNRYLKWAYMEAGNVVSINRRRLRAEHVRQLYLRIRGRRGHQKAVGAVARHLAEATFWMLTKGEEYREPERPSVSSTRR